MNHSQPDPLQSNPTAEPEQLQAQTRALTSLVLVAELLDGLLLDAEHEAAGTVDLRQDLILRFIFSVNAMYPVDGAQLRRDTLALADAVGATILIGPDVTPAGKVM